MVPAEAEQNALLEAGRRDNVRQTLAHTPGTRIFAPGVFPAAAFSESGHCALPGSSGAATQPVEVGSRQGANLLQNYTGLET